MVLAAVVASNSSVAQSQVSFSAEDDKNSAIPEGYSSTAVGSAAAQSLSPRLVFPPSYPYPASPPRYAYRYPIPGVPPSQSHGAPPEYQAERAPAKQPQPRFRRTVVDYPTAEPAGTIIIDAPNTYLYLTIGHGKAIRYGIGVGREGSTWSGTGRISRMKEWPDWLPPKEMIKRQPYLPRFMTGGETNPLCARNVSRQHGISHPRY